MADKTYNGWTNYETWLCKLWLDNEEYICNELVPQWAEESNGDAYDCGQLVKDYVEDPENGFVPDVSGFGADLINAALSEIDWREIGESIIEDWPRSEDEDEDEDTED